MLPVIYEPKDALSVNGTLKGSFLFLDPRLAFHDSRLKIIFGTASQFVLCLKRAALAPPFLNQLSSVWLLSANRRFEHPVGGASKLKEHRLCIEVGFS